MPGRIIAIGDIHGCLPALNALLSVLRPQPDDTLITLGDYVDRGPDSRGTIARLLDLLRQCRLIPLLGNHDQMFLDVCAGRRELLESWLLYGGIATVACYGGKVPAGVPAEHLDFLRHCRLCYETDRHFFVHGSYLADEPLEQQPPEVVLWDAVKRRQPGPHYSGKTAILGHSAQRSGEILDLGYLKCIDTWCYGDGWLTALEVVTGQVWQANKRGTLRM